MKIKIIESMIRRDFSAIYVCGHCGNEEKGYGYDDEYFHHHVIPEMKCKKCGMIEGKDYDPRKTKYSSHEIV